MPRKPVVDTEEPIDDIEDTDDVDLDETEDDAGEGLPESDLTDDIGTLDVEAPAATDAPPKVEVMMEGRVFKIGSTTIAESEATVGLTNEQVREMLKASFPEVANATIGVKSEDGVTVVSFLPQPGRKG